MGLVFNYAHLGSKSRKVLGALGRLGSMEGWVKGKGRSNERVSPREGLSQGVGLP